MKILLIQGYLGRKEPPVFPLGIASIAGNISGEHIIRIFDPNTALKPYDNTLAVIEDFAPDIIGVSVRNIDTTKYSDFVYYYPSFRKFIKLVKEVSGNAVITVGGTGFSLYPAEIMEQCSEIDFGFTGEAEITFNRFLETGLNPEPLSGIYFRESGGLKFTGNANKPELQELNPPKWDLLDLKPYLPYTGKSSIGVESKRGCVFGCSYCVYPQLSGNKLRIKSPRKTVDEIEHLNKTFGVDRIFFTDPIFNFPLKHAQAVCKELTQRNLKIKWGAYHHYGFIDANYIRLAREAGCDEFYFSPDAASEKGLKVLKKGAPVKKLKESLDIIAEDKEANAAYNFFAVFPGSGWGDILAAISFIISAKFRLKNRFKRYKLSYLKPEPGASILEYINSNPSMNILPEDEKEAAGFFYRKSESKLLNIFIFLHYHWGKKFGKKNAL